MEYNIVYLIIDLILLRLINLNLLIILKVEHYGMNSFIYGFNKCIRYIDIKHS